MGKNISKKLAEHIVARLIEDIEDRSGLGNEWEEIDDEVKEEIKARWVAIITATIK